MNKTNLENTYKFIRLRLEMYAEDDSNRELYIFGAPTYEYVMERLKKDGFHAEFEQMGAWEYKLRKVEFKDGN